MDEYSEDMDMSVDADMSADIDVDVEPDIDMESDVDMEIEDDIIEDDVIEDDVIEDDVIEGDVIEDDVIEDDVIEDDVIEDEIDEPDLSGDDSIEAEMEEELEEVEEVEEELPGESEEATEETEEALIETGEEVPEEATEMEEEPIETIEEPTEMEEEPVEVIEEPGEMEEEPAETVEVEEELPEADEEVAETPEEVVEEVEETLDEVEEAADELPAEMEEEPIETIEEPTEMEEEPVEVIEEPGEMEEEPAETVEVEEELLEADEEMEETPDEVEEAADELPAEMEEEPIETIEEPTELEEEPAETVEVEEELPEADEEVAETLEEVVEEVEETPDEVDEAADELPAEMEEEPIETIEEPTKLEEEPVEVIEEPTELEEESAETNEVEEELPESDEAVADTPEEVVEEVEETPDEVDEAADEMPAELEEESVETIEESGELEEEPIEIAETAEDTEDSASDIDTEAETMADISPEEEIPAEEDIVAEEPTMEEAESPQQHTFDDWINPENYDEDGHYIGQGQDFGYKPEGMDTDEYAEQIDQEARDSYAEHLAQQDMPWEEQAEAYTDYVEAQDNYGETTEVLPEEDEVDDIIETDIIPDDIIDDQMNEAEDILTDDFNMIQDIEADVEDVNETLETGNTADIQVEEIHVEEVDTTAVPDMPMSPPPMKDEVDMGNEVELRERETIQNDVPEVAAKDITSDTKPTAFEQMHAYMCEHNYGRGDYMEYSQDPEWQRLNEELKQELGMPVDIPAYDNDNMNGSSTETMTADPGSSQNTPANTMNQGQTEAVETEKPRGKIATFFDNIFGRTPKEDVSAGMETMSDSMEDKDLVTTITDMDYENLSDKDKSLMYDTAKDYISQEYGDLMSGKRIKDIPNHVKIEDTETCTEIYEAATGEKYEDTTIGFYLPATDEIYVDAPKNGDMTEIMATVEHESLHYVSDGGVLEMLYDTDARTMSADLATNLNEGITEMYASRDMENMGFEYNSNSYVTEVEVAQALEDAIGADKMREAYFTHKPGIIRSEFETAFTTKDMTGKGSYEEFLYDFNRLIKTQKGEVTGVDYWEQRNKVFGWITELKAKRRGV